MTPAFRLAAVCAALCTTLGASPAVAADCPTAPAPVYSLSFESRYADDSETRSEIDADAKAKAEEALDPIDDFLRDLTEAANSVYDEKTDAKAMADCVVAAMAVWAKANALADLQSETAQLTIGSRIAGFGLVLLQVLPHGGAQGDVHLIRTWLSGLVYAQMQFWEEDAPKGASQGNLRAWAALGAASVAPFLDDSTVLGWAAWSTRFVLCKADADGSLPQEMTRGHLALQYQLHAIAPLVVSTLLLKRRGTDLTPICDGALARVVNFALSDLQTGEMTKAITGETQSFFDGSDTLEGFHMAWLEAYLQLDPGSESGLAGKVAAEFRPLSYSKLGGDQALIWRDQ